MARRAEQLSTFTSGVIDPSLSDRIDLKYYWQSFADAKNVTVTPQGGFRRKWGTRLISAPDVLAAGYRRRQRRRLSRIDLTAFGQTVPNGGTVASLEDDDSTTVFTTANAPAANTLFSVYEADLGVETPVVFVDLIGFKAGSAGADDAIGVQYWDAGTSTWKYIAGAASSSLSPLKAIRTTERTRRFGEWPGGPAGTVISSRYWRVVVLTAAAVGTISLRGLRLWTERAQIGPVKDISFAKSKELVYDLILTDRNIDVFRDYRYVASIPVPIPAEYIDEVTIYQSLDTLILYHEDIETVVVTRQGADDEWNAAPFAASGSVPTLTSSTGYAENVDEVQEIYFNGLGASAASVRLWQGDQASAPFSWTGTGSLATLAASVKTALTGLNGAVSAGITVSLLSGSIPAVRVVWSGSNGSRRWPRVFAETVTGLLATETRVIERGNQASGPLFGATTGYARCGLVHQGRHIMGGFRAAPATIAYSRTSNIYDFAIPGTLTADAPMIRTLESDQVETIKQIYVGRHLQVFTDSGEWFDESRSFDATQPPNFVIATRYGLEAATPVVFAENATIFVQNGAMTLRSFVYTNIEESYEADPISLLAPHLLKTVVDVTSRPARSTDEGNNIFMLNADGTIAHLSLLAKQEVNAITPLEFIAPVRALARDVKSRVSFVSEINGDLYLVEYVKDVILDLATTITPSGPTSSVSGLYHLANRTDVCAYLDGELFTNLTVSSGGVCTLPIAASSSIEIGLSSEVYGRLPTPRGKLQNEMPFRGPARVYTLEATVEQTGQLQVRANNSTWTDIVLTHLDDARLDAGWRQSGGRIDKPMLERLFTGYATVPPGTMRNWLKHPTIEFRQTVPAPLHVESLRYELAMRG